MKIGREVILATDEFYLPHKVVSEFLIFFLLVISAEQGLVTTDVSSPIEGEENRLAMSCILTEYIPSMMWHYRYPEVTMRIFFQQVYAGVACVAAME